MSHDLRLYESATISNVVQKDPDGDSAVIVEGYASFYRHDSGLLQVDRDNEVVNTDMLDLDAYTKNPVLCYNHDWGDIVGRILEVNRDTNGIKVKAQVDRLTGRESVYENVKLGNIKSFSIGFIPQDYDYFDDGVVEISKASLIEISLAPVQANPEALFSVIGTKSLGVSANRFAQQNNLSNADMRDMFHNDIKKGNDMKTKSVEAEEAAKLKAEEEAKAKAEADAKEAAKLKAEEEAKAKAEADTKAEADVPQNVDLATLVNALAESALKADQLKADKEAAELAAKAEAEAAKKAEEASRVQSALDYIKEQTEVISNTPASELDTDDLELYYELVSTATETIEAKVIELTSSVGAE